MSTVEMPPPGISEAIASMRNWLKDRESPRTLDYLKAENRRTDSSLAGLEGLRSDLFRELLGRIKEDDASVPYLYNGYWYHHRNFVGKDYPVYYRRAQQADAVDEVYLDCNALAAGEDYMEVGLMEISPDNRWLAYGVDKSGDELYEIRFRDLTTGRDLPYTVPKASYSGAWSADSTAFYYVKEDRTRRPHAVYRHRIGTSWRSDRCVYREQDAAFYVDVGTSQDGELIFFTSESKTTTECSYCFSADKEPKPRVVRKRVAGVRYYPDHFHGQLIVRCNRIHQNFALMSGPLNEAGDCEWQVLLPTDETINCKDFLVFQQHVVSLESVRGQDRVRILHMSSGQEHVITFPGEGYVLEDATNMEFATDELHLHYSALNVPSRIYCYDMQHRSLRMLKEQEVPCGHDPEDFVVQRVWFRGEDGEEIPTTLAYRNDLDLTCPQPTVLTGYGAYGIKEDIGFSIAALSYLNRGCIYAVAHVRGGGFLGEAWYQAGKLRQKRNSFRDFIAVAQALIASGRTSARQLVIEGSSAGGLLIAGVLNSRPDLFRGAVASVPFVDVLASMQEEDLPLTTFEYEEWGNPADPDDFQYIASYSPVDTVKQAQYPPILITVGLQDPRVPYWEGCLWATQLRRASMGETEVLVRVNFGSGHSGASGRYENLRELAFEQAFLLNLLELG